MLPTEPHDEPHGEPRAESHAESPRAAGEAPTGLREAKKARTRAALALAALELAAEEGLHATTVDAIAARAGVSPRTFFNYFDSKDEAAVHLSIDRFRRLMARLFTGEPTPGENPVLQIRDVMLEFLVDADQDAGSHDELLRTALERDAALFAALHASMTTIGAEFEAAIAARYADDRDRDLARVGLSVALGFTQTAVLDLRDGRSADPLDQRVAHFFRLLESALR